MTPSTEWTHTEVSDEISCKKFDFFSCLIHPDNNMGDLLNCHQTLKLDYRQHFS